MTRLPKTDPLLEIKNLSVRFKSYGKTTPILNNVSFSLESQKTLGIVGESGCGKTVTALSILNLIPSPPLERITGEIRFNGENLLKLSPKKLRRIRGKEIAYIFQEPMTALNPVYTVGEQISEMIRTHENVGRKEATERGIWLLNEVGITNPTSRMNSYPHQISGGMRQRVMIAIALSCDPKILIADEPTTALDVTIQAQVLELFKTLIEKRRMSIIFVTHDLGVIAEIADEVIVMRKGAVVESNSVEAIFHQPVHPYTKSLVQLLTGEDTR